MSVSEAEKFSQIMTKDFSYDFCFFPLELGSTIIDSPPSQPLQLDDNPIYFSLQVLSLSRSCHLCVCVCVCLFLLIIYEIMEDTPQAEAEIYGKVLFYLRTMKTMEKFHTLNKWIVYKLNTDNFEAHLCQTSWTTPFGPPYSGMSQFRGEYEFVEVMMREKEGCKKMRVIIDLDFRTQFELARPTSNYQELINALPLIFVGSEEKLEKLISLICNAAKQSLRERGLHIPPWRKAAYIHSKWLSTNCKRLPIPFSQTNLKTFTGKNIGCFQDFVEAQKMGIFD